MHWTDARRLIEVICKESNYNKDVIEERIEKLSQAFPDDENVKEAIEQFYEQSSMRQSDACRLLVIISEESGYKLSVIRERLEKLSQAFPNDESVTAAIKTFREELEVKRSNYSV